MKIQSFVPSGSGAWVLHAELQRALAGYSVRAYSPWWELFPWGLSLLPKGNPDVIHATLDYGVFVQKSDLPLVTTAHNYVLDSEMQPYSSLLQRVHYRTDLQWFTQRGLKCSDRVIAVSQFVADRLKHDLDYQGRLNIIYNGIDEAIFTPGGSDRKDHKFSVLFSGNTNLRKRANLLVPLANALGSNFEIYYTSGLSGSAALQGHPLTNSARLIPLGTLPHKRMPDIYRQMDVLFMPSVREGFGLSVAEAMACQMPVVAADASALPELLHHGKGGYLCPIDDVTSYAEAIKSIAESPELAKNMGEYNRTLVEERFTLSRMVTEYRQLFEELLDTR